MSYQTEGTTFSTKINSECRITSETDMLKLGEAEKKGKLAKH